MTLQVRPRSGMGDKKMYAPNRDIAWVTPDFTRVALEAMGEINWNADAYGPYLRDTNTTEEDLGKAAEALAKAYGLFCDDEIKSPLEALTKAGFFDTPTPAQVAIVYKVGQVFIGSFFVGIRDVLLKGEDKPASVAELIEAGRSLAVRLNGRPKEGASDS